VSGGHAVEYRPTGAGPFSVNWDGNQLTGYAVSDGSTGDEAILIHPVTNSANITLNVINGATTPTIMEHADYTGTFTLVVNPVTTAIHVQDESGTDVASARVLVKAADGTGDFDFDTTITSITQTGGTATVTQTAHPYKTSDYVLIEDAIPEGYNKVALVTVTGANTYTYTVDSGLTSPATGSPVATGVAIYGTTDVNGDISASKSFSLSQPIIGWARKTSGAPYLKPGAITGTIDNANGLTVTVTLISDE
jgi:hypothetical protein